MWRRFFIHLFLQPSITLVHFFHFNFSVYLLRFVPFRFFVLILGSLCRISERAPGEIGKKLVFLTPVDDNEKGAGKKRQGCINSWENFERDPYCFFRYGWKRAPCELLGLVETGGT